MSNALIGDYVFRDLPRTEEVDLLEVATDDGFQDALSQVMSSDLPGFVIRGAGLEGNPLSSPLDLVDLVEATLADQGHVFKRGQNLRHTVAASILGVGPLHIDVECGKSVEALDLHTTVQGSGRVIIAEAACTMRQLLKPKATFERAEQERHLNNLLMSGRIDPDIIRPVIHGTMLQAGDHLVIPKANERGPVWRRINTSSGSRAIDMWVLDRVPEAN